MRRLFLIFSTAAVAFALAGCTSTSMETNAEDPAAMVSQQEASDGFDVTQVDAEDVIDGIFDIKGLDVVSYRLRGEGPDGAYFDWIEVTEPRVAIADVRRGEWTLYAQGLNADGEPVIQGKLETFLSEDSPIDNLVFQEDYGTGDVRCAFAWNPSQVQHPNVEIYMRKSTGGEWVARDISEIMVGDGTAMWTTSGLSSGSYVIRIILKDRSTIVSGAAAALRVVDDKLSVGQVRLTVGDLSQIYGITLDNVPANTVQGMLAISQKGVVYRTLEEGLLYDWFIDGEYLDGFSAQEIEIPELLRGYHRIDCIVRTQDYGSINSDTIHIFSDGEYITEVSEAEVNAVIKDFKATLANEEELRNTTGAFQPGTADYEFEVDGGDPESGSGLTAPSVPIITAQSVPDSEKQAPATDDIIRAADAS